MLFLLKCRWEPALAALVLLAGLGLGLRQWLDTGAPFWFSASAIFIGMAMCGGVLCCDAVLHGLFCALLGEAYRKRHRELVAVFRGQTNLAILAGAALAGVGEELVFRGLGTGVAYLAGAALVFGLLHHIRRSLWPFTLWSIFEGFLFAVALYVFGELSVTMTAHFLHDACGFLLFRYLNRSYLSRPNDQ